MADQIDELILHDGSDDCPVCRAQDFTNLVMVPAVAAWEQSNDLPRFSLALNGAAALLGAMIEEGMSRDDIEKALSELLDDVEAQIAEDKAMGGPPQGTA